MLKTNSKRVHSVQGRGNYFNVFPVTVLYGIRRACSMVLFVSFGQKRKIAATVQLKKKQTFRERLKRGYSALGWFTNVFRLPAFLICNCNKWVCGAASITWQCFHLVCWGMSEWLRFKATGRSALCMHSCKYVHRACINIGNLGQLEQSLGWFCRKSDQLERQDCVCLWMCLWQRNVGRSSFTSKLVCCYEACHISLESQLCYWASSGYAHLWILFHFCSFVLCSAVFVQCLRQ